MRREEYAAAEELLSALSDRWPHRDALQAGLLRRTGRGEEAAELWERRLLNAATEVYESAVSLSSGPSRGAAGATWVAPGGRPH